MKQLLNDLQSQIGINFANPDTLLQALIHRSYLNENKAPNLHSNERIEFLGDAILELWVTEKLFTIFPDLPEGDLTNLRSLIVCTDNLAKVAKEFNLGQYIMLSHGEETHQGRQNLSILADTFESLIGAVYLDSGNIAANQFLEKFISPSINQLSQQKIYKDPKSLFQEIAQSKRGVTPNYKTIAESGPDHKKTFEVGVYLNDNLITTGKGISKQKAEEAAAITATKKLSDN